MRSSRARIWLNAVAALAAVVATALAAVGGRADQQLELEHPARVSVDERVRLPDGRWALPDATGVLVPLARYERILGASVVADRLLVELCEPDRIAGFSRASRASAPQAYRYAGKPTLDGLRRIEAVLELGPDLVLAHSVGNAAAIRALREAGVTVFDLGAMQGMTTLPDNARVVAALLGAPERGRRLAEEMVWRMQRVAGKRRAGVRPGALYIGIHGDKLYGGTRGSSFHDVLVAAGLRDVAAAEYEGWPKYTAEQLLSLDPEVIVTQADMAKSLCDHSELGTLRACSEQGRVIGMAPGLIRDPGLPMLQAAEVLHAAVFGGAR